MSTVLEARDLFRFFHTGDTETLALRGVSLSVQEGEMVAITGPSGSGKSTLLACLAGLDDPDGGCVWVDGQTMSRRPEVEKAAVRSRHIGVLLQANNLIDHLSVGENILLAQRLAGRVDKDRAEALLESTGIGHRAASLPSQLSRGEAVRAGLAVALANDPTLVLADEPTGELDGDSERRVVGLLHDITRRDGSVFVVTHNPAVSTAADRCLQLADGRLVK